jgi:hypothetical protein
MKVIKKFNSRIIQNAYTNQIAVKSPHFIRKTYRRIRPIAKEMNQSLAIGVSAQSLHQRRTMFDRGEGLCGLNESHQKILLTDNTKRLHKSNSS